MKRTITKKDVAKRTAKLVGEKIYLAERIVDGVFTSLRQFMAEADPEVRIEIRDFGVFEVKTTKPKPKARNPKTLVSLSSQTTVGSSNRLFKAVTNLSVTWAALPTSAFIVMGKPTTILITS